MPNGWRYRALRALGHAPHFKGKDLLLRAIAHPDRQVSRPFEVPFFGHVYPGDMANFMDWTVFAYGAHAEDELFLFRDVVEVLAKQRGAVTFFDIGANVGNHTLFMADKVAAVHAFEPYPPVAAKIRQKIARNGLENVTVHPIALSDRDGLAMFREPEGANQGTGTLAGGGGRLETPVRQGDAYLAEQGLPRIDLIKIDVEGHEAAVVRGLAERLGRDRPVILAEISGVDFSGFGDEAGLRESLYSDHRIFSLAAGKGGYGLAPFVLGAASEILIVPAEASALLARLSAFAVR